MLDEHVMDLLPGYALGSLDEEDLVRVARHLPRCAACREELNSFLVTVDQLALAAPELTPPPTLRARVIKQVERRAARQAAPAPEPVKPGWRESLRALFSPRAAFGIAAVLLLILGLSTFLLARQVDSLQARLPAGDARIVNLAGTTNAPQAVGYMVVFPDENFGTVVVSHAPPLEAGKQYQVWLIKDGKRTSGGVFSVNTEGYGALEIAADAPLTTFDAVGITVEPAGGSPGPTGAKILGNQ